MSKLFAKILIGKKAVIGAIGAVVVGGGVTTAVVMTQNNDEQAKDSNQKNVEKYKKRDRNEKETDKTKQEEPHSDLVVTEEKPVDVIEPVEPSPETINHNNTEPSNKLIVSLEPTKEQPSTNNIVEKLASLTKPENLGKPFSEDKGKLEDLGEKFNEDKAKPEDLGKPSSEDKAKPEDLGKPSSEDKAKPENLSKPSGEDKAKPEDLGKPSGEDKVKPETKPETEKPETKPETEKPETKPETEKPETQDPFYVEPPKTSGFNHNLRNKLGSYGSYNGIKKSYFDSLVQDIASGDILELDAKEELYKLDLWNENNIPSYLPKNTQMGVAVVNVQKFSTSSNNYRDIDKMIGKNYGGKYFGISIYWDAQTKKNTIALLNIQFMYQ
ncbi:hypothetical protein BACERE00176_05454 [Bacillus paranthracis]|uniref:hypothetical protein n=1 Tax=Bacillus paranthracis TaxID=2026186 RepID=UPI000A303B27|nr:hypothetical protein [Bacillus paranthracis]SME52274.1 hypothetical protein BACERE00176_05454 [Bacillus paranthracis]